MTRVGLAQSQELEPPSGSHVGGRDSSPGASSAASYGARDYVIRHRHYNSQPGGLTLGPNTCPIAGVLILQVKL